MPKILIATDKPFAAPAVQQMKQILEGTGYNVVMLEKYKEQADLMNAVAGIDAMIVRSDLATKEVLANANNLKIIVRAGAGYDNIDIEEATSKNIVVMNTPGQNANAVAELVFGMMVYVARSGFDGKSGTELRNKSLGIHAYGNIGKLVAQIGKGFGMIVYAFDPFVTKEKMEQDGVNFIATAEELYKTCQYVSIHMPANSATKKSLGFSLLSTMPKGATLINTARKEVIDEEGLLKVFAERLDFKYISDIEPECKADIIANYPGRYYFTPKKMGAQTEEANTNAGLAAAKQIVNFFEKGDKTFQVNK